MTDNTEALSEREQRLDRIIEMAEETLAMGKGAWDMVAGREIAAAIIDAHARLARADAVSLPVLAGPDDQALTRAQEIVAFLRGEQKLDGFWFGDRRPGYAGAYWWRSAFLPELTAALPGVAVSLPAPDARGSHIEGNAATTVPSDDHGLAEEMAAWQTLGAETLARTDEAIASLPVDEPPTNSAPVSRSLVDEPREYPAGCEPELRYLGRCELRETETGDVKLLRVWNNPKHRMATDCSNQSPAVGVYIGRPVSPAQAFRPPEGWACDICTKPVDPSEDRFIVDGDRQVAHTSCLEYATSGRTPQQIFGDLTNWFNAEPVYGPTQETALSGEPVDPAMQAWQEHLRGCARCRNQQTLCEDGWRLRSSATLEKARKARRATVPVAEPALSVERLLEALRNIQQIAEDETLDASDRAKIAAKLARVTLRAALSGSEPVEGNDV